MPRERSNRRARGRHRPERWTTKGLGSNGMPRLAEIVRSGSELIALLLSTFPLLTRSLSNQPPHLPTALPVALQRLYTTTPTHTTHTDMSYGYGSSPPYCRHARSSTHLLPFFERQQEEAAEATAEEEEEVDTAVVEEEDTVVEEEDTVRLPFSTGRTFQEQEY